MLFMVKWKEKAQGSAEAYDQAQERVLRLFGQWDAGPRTTVHHFVVRAGSFSGYIILETDDLADMHKLATIYSTFEIEVEPFIHVTRAAALEAEAVAARGALLQRL